MLIQPNKAPSRTPQQQAAPEVDAQQSQQAQEVPEPAEALVIKQLLDSLGHKKHDPAVVQLLMELTYSNTAEILREAEAINLAAGGTGAELTPQDIALAASQQTRKHPEPPTLQELHALARVVNRQPLTGPSDKQHGIKLPPVADCLLSQNYQLRPKPRPAPPPQLPAARAAGSPRQYYAVKQQHDKLSTKIPQQWQPAPDAAAGSVEPFAAPAPRQQQQQQEQQPMAIDAEQQRLQDMAVTEEDI
ncbi:hypothetical protein D9Q98_009914 [Chlorella vulgaris]|uniref:Transcription initiation factor TFIID subunit 9 n=1 Tax=Chlorella vulgaris TaxID=3077 RepID=A0A9D4YT35_CHLVU|nr:hypothetical protein D9Q98_009914 [Chlorella vulgaris]